MIKIEHLKKEYELSCPLKDINVTINKGEVVCIIGPSGTGKSTLLRMINLLDTPTSGKIFFDGEEITAPSYKKENARKKMAMVFQNYNLFNHLSIIENLVVPQVDLLGKTKDQAYNKAMELLESVGMKRQYLNYPSSLSGGQKQRVAIARALAMEPDVILFDEPTSALDPIMVGEIKTIMKKLASEGQTMLIVTHDMELAEEVASRILYLDQGVVYEDNTPEIIFNNPKRARTKAFIENLNVLKTSIHTNYNHEQIDEEVEKFISDLKIDDKSASKIRIVYDDFLFGTLIEKHNIKDIRLIVSYDQKKSNVYVNCKYSGDNTNLLKKSLNPPSRLMSNIKNVKFNNIIEKNYTNQLLFETK